MAFTIERFNAFRPYCYHTTSENNLELIREARKLFSATVRKEKVGLPMTKIARKDGPQLLRGDLGQLQSQHPLIERKIQLMENWDFQDLLRSLDEKVFFWPGAESGPVRYGRNHFEGNVWGNGQKPRILRVRTEELISNTSQPLFCRYNSGAPRCNPVTGKSPRGPETFLPCGKFDSSVSDVVEVVFFNEVILPESTEVSETPSGGWVRLFSPFALGANSQDLFAEG